MFEWDRQGALDLLEDYKNFWGPAKNPEFGITGRPDANTGKVNSPSVYETVLNHGDGGKSRNKMVFVGGGIILKELINFLEQDVFLEEDLEVFDELEQDFKKLETTEKRNPANIEFRTVIKFTPPKGDDEPEIERGWVKGHFLTVPYWEFRQWKAKETGGSFVSSKPKPEWYSMPVKAGGKGSSNTAKPPLWQAILGPDNSLRILVESVKQLIEKSAGPGSTPINIYVNANLGLGTGVAQMATIAGLNKAIREVIADGSIYASGTKIAVKDRLNEAVNSKSFSISQSDLKILVENCTVKIDEEKVELDEVVNYEKINNVSLKFPKNNKTLNKIIREVMGEQMNTYKVPGNTQSDGITLKQIDAMQAFSNLMKVLK
tara:strand:+ start:264 stop:1388 length:1125 start_codon:yes stop_codon:yes gene_type:complete